MATIRDSNIELMRLICMMMILIHHMICHGIFSVDTILCHIGSVNTTISFSILVNNFCYIGVNCFILISGYYSIKFKFKSLFNLYLICLFYSLILHALDIYLFNNRTFSLGVFKDLIFVFSQQDYWWFIRCYVILYLLSPLLNKCLNALSQNEYKCVLILLTIANVYFGYWWNRYADNGYSVAQFVYVYSIGRYIYMFVEKKKIVSHRWQFLLSYLGIMITFSILSIASHYLSIPHWKSLPYNNPLLLIGAISFFIFMLSYHFQSKIINKLAVSSLAIYLLQNFELMRRWANTFSNTIGINFEVDEGLKVIVLLFVFLIGFAILFSILSIMIDQIRILLVSPIVNYVGRTFISQKIDLLFSPKK